MEETLHSSVTTDLLLTILNRSLNGLIAYEAVRDENGRIVDFAHRLINEPAYRYFPSLKNWRPGMTLRQGYPGPRLLDSRLFPTYVVVCETGQPFKGDQYYPELDRWLQLSITALPDGILLSFIDVTESKRAEQDRQRKTDLLEAVVYNAPAGLVLYEAVRDAAGAIRDFRYVLTNPANAAITGRSVEQMTGQLLTELFPTCLENGFFAQLAAVTETGEPIRSYFPFDGDGIWGWFSASFVRQGDGVLFTFLDQTDAEQAQSAFEAQAELLRTIIDGVPNAINVCEVVRDGAGAIVDFRLKLFNAATAALWPSSTLQPGELFTHRFPKGREEEDFRMMKLAFETGEPQRYVRESPSVPGQYVDIAVNRFNDGVIVAITDVTAVRRNQQSLERANEDLRRSNDNLQQFAYVASHDLQEPLRKIQAFGDVLKSQYAPQLGDGGADIVLRMQAAALRMSVLIKDLLTYSRLTTHQEPFSLVSLDVLFGDILDDLEVSVRESLAVITLCSLPDVMGDALQLRQLFQNLFSNAIKFRKPGQAPQIQIDCQELEPGSDRPAALLGDYTYYEISISDNGIGFDPKYTDRIFQVFQRLHGRNQYEGTGVGLAICKKVVDNHGGLILAEGRPGDGATFRIYFPKLVA